MFSLNTALTFSRGANSWNKLKIETKVNNSQIVFAAYGLMSRITRINKTFSRGGFLSLRERRDDTS